MPSRSKGEKTIGADDKVVENRNTKQGARLSKPFCHYPILVAGRSVATYAACGISGVMPHPVLCRMAPALPWFSWVKPFPIAA